MTLQLQAVEGSPSTQQNFDQIAQRFPINAQDLVNGLPGGVFPSNPVNGQQFVLTVDVANGVYWNFVRDATNARWVFIGGTPLFSEITASEATASITYVALATAGPAVTLPFAGDYIVTIGCHGFSNVAAGAQWNNLMSYDIGGTGAVDADFAVMGGANATVAVAGESAARVRRKNGLGAVTLTAKYRVTVGTGTFVNRWMSVTPVRI